MSNSARDVIAAHVIWYSSNPDLEGQRAEARKDADAILIALREAGFAVVPVGTLMKLFHAKDDHMTACDKTMGDTHQCTCGANALRAFLKAAQGGE